MDLASIITKIGLNSSNKLVYSSSYTVQEGDTYHSLGLQFGLSEADLIAYNNGNKNLIVGETILVPNLYKTVNAENKTISPYDENQKVVAFAGIGYPRKFFGALKNVAATRAFPDHWDYTDDDLNNILNSNLKYLNLFFFYTHYISQYNHYIHHHHLFGYMYY